MKDFGHRIFKDQLYEQFARISRAMANPHRLELLDLLAQGERTVEDLAALSGMSIANASQHLQQLRAARLVEVRREGLYGYYRLADERVFRAWQAIRDLGTARIAEIERLEEDFLGDRQRLETVDAEELAARLEGGEIVVLDVRPHEEYQAGHIPGALSVPVAEMESYLRLLPRDREIVAYCRGPYCVFSDEAVALLKAYGFKASRLREGLPDWRLRGLPVQTET